LRKIKGKKFKRKTRKKKLLITKKQPENKKLQLMRIPKKRKIRINLMKHLNTTTLRNQLKRRINLM
jgi:hypothetical protein